LCEVTCWNGTSAFITIITQAAFFNYWSGDRKSWQLVWYSSVPPVSWPLPPPRTLTYASSSPVQGVWTLIKRTHAVVFMSDILLQLTANASQDVFLNLFPSSETKFFRFSWQLLSKWEWSFGFVHPVVLCLMSLQYPCELLQTLKMEAVHPSKVSEHRKKTLHNVEPQKTTVTLQINLHVSDH
jgi:hypothetical protein